MSQSNYQIQTLSQSLTLKLNLKLQCLGLYLYSRDNVTMSFLINNNKGLVPNSVPDYVQDQVPTQSSGTTIVHGHSTKSRLGTIKIKSNLNSK